MDADVVVIGAGVVGCAIARELAHHPRLRTALVDAADDVGEGTSKANTAILHTGFDAAPGTVEARLVARGYTLLAEYAGQTGIAVERTGALLVAWTPDELAALPALAAKAAANGYGRTRPVGVDELRGREPHLGPGALGALEVPDESVVDPWSPTVAFATQAVRAGVRLHLGTAVTGVRAGPGVHVLQVRRPDGGRGELRARYVVNAAGLAGDAVDRWMGFGGFTVTPRRGQLVVFDKLARPLVRHVLLPVPTALGKGVLVAPTVFGNVMLGPTAENLQDRSATGTSEAGFEFLLGKGRALMPRLLDEEVTAAYAGLRAAVDGDDYLIDLDAGRRYLLVGGIRSTGLTASLAIAEHVHGLLAEAGLDLAERPDLPPPPRMPNLGEAFPRPYQDADLIARDAEYGRVVCFCERVTAGEIRDAYASTVPPAGLEGLRRRTRVMNGRCQGFYCGAQVDALVRSGGVPR